MNEYKRKLAADAGQVNRDAAAEAPAATNGIPNSVLTEVFAGRRKADSRMMGNRVNLAESINAKMSQAFGMDVSQIQFYRSSAMSGTDMKGISQGNKVVLSSDVDLNTGEGQAVLGHELSHIHAQAQGIGMGHGGLYSNAALEHQADVEGMRAAHGRPIYEQPMMGNPGMSYGLGMRGVEDLTPISPNGIGASAGAPMQAKKKKDDAARDEMVQKIASGKETLDNEVTEEDMIYDEIRQRQESEKTADSKELQRLMGSAFQTHKSLTDMVYFPMRGYRTSLIRGMGTLEEMNVSKNGQELTSEEQVALNQKYMKAINPFHKDYGYANDLIERGDVAGFARMIANLEFPVPEKDKNNNYYFTGDDPYTYSQDYLDHALKISKENGVYKDKKNNSNITKPRTGSPIANYNYTAIHEVNLEDRKKKTNIGQTVDQTVEQKPNDYDNLPATTGYDVYKGNVRDLSGNSTVQIISGLKGKDKYKTNGEIYKKENKKNKTKELTGEELERDNMRIHRDPGQLYMDNVKEFLARTASEKKKAANQVHKSSIDANKLLSSASAGGNQEESPEQKKFNQFFSEFGYSKDKADIEKDSKPFRPFEPKKGSAEVDHLNQLRKEEETQRGKLKNVTQEELDELPALMGGTYTPGTEGNEGTGAFNTHGRLADRLSMPMRGYRGAEVRSMGMTAEMKAIEKKRRNETFSTEDQKKLNIALMNEINPFNENYHYLRADPEKTDEENIGKIKQDEFGSEKDKTVRQLIDSGNVVEFFDLIKQQKFPVPKIEDIEDEKDKEDKEDKKIKLSFTDKEKEMYNQSYLNHALRQYKSDPNGVIGTANPDFKGYKDLAFKLKDVDGNPLPDEQHIDPIKIGKRYKK